MVLINIIIYGVMSYSQFLHVLLTTHGNPAIDNINVEL